MSRFCGKCDFYDWISDKTDEEINRSEFYIYHEGRRLKLDIHSQYDAALYYPYLVSIGCHSDDKDVIVLSNDCFIDTEEQEHISWWVRDTWKEVRKYKRNKEYPDANKIYEKLSWGGWNNKQLKEVVNEIIKNGDNAKFDHIHLNLQEYHRRTWYDYLVEIGYDSTMAFNWVYKGFLTNKEEMQERLKQGA